LSTPISSLVQHRKNVRFESPSGRRGEHCPRRLPVPHRETETCRLLRGLIAASLLLGHRGLSTGARTPAGKRRGAAARPRAWSKEEAVCPSGRNAPSSIKLNDPVVATGFV